MSTVGWDPTNKHYYYTFTTAVQSLYDIKFAVKTVQKILVSFRENKWFRQGCCISPTLFKIYTAKTIMQWKRKYNKLLKSSFARFKGIQLKYSDDFY